MEYVFGSGRVGGVGGEWVRGLGLGSTNPRGTGGKWDMCMCFGCGGVGGGGRSRFLYIVLGGYLRILGAPSV